jgi:hypothetical protein
VTGGVVVLKHHRLAVVGTTTTPGAEARSHAGVHGEHWRADLRSGAGVTGGPAPFAKADRSRFLQALDEALVRLEVSSRLRDGC